MSGTFAPFHKATDEQSRDLLVYKPTDKALVSLSQMTGRFSERLGLWLLLLPGLDSEVTPQGPAVVVPLVAAFQV